MHTRINAGIPACWEGPVATALQPESALHNYEEVNTRKRCDVRYFLDMRLSDILFLRILKRSYRTHALVYLAASWTDLTV